jgi:hypothetical protein
MCVARIGFGLALFWSYFSLLPSFSVALGPDGLLGASFLDDVPGPTVGRATTEHVRWLQAVPEPAVLWALYYLLLAAAVAFIVGYRTRLAGAAALVLHLAFHGRNEFVFWGWADMITPFLLYVVLAPSGRRLSVDALLAERARRRSLGANEISCGDGGGDGQPPRQALTVAWPMRLLQVHVTLVYVVAAWSRLDNQHWIDGSMLSRILSDGTFSRAPALGAAPGPVLAMLTYLAWALELVAPFSLWQASTRRWIVAGLVALHVGLELTTDVGFWNVVMIAALTAFMPQSWLEAFVDCLSAGLRRDLSLLRQRWTAISQPAWPRLRR